MLIETITMWNRNNFFFPEDFSFGLCVDSVRKFYSMPDLEVMLLQTYDESVSGSVSFSFDGLYLRVDGEKFIMSYFFKYHYERHHTLGQKYYVKMTPMFEAWRICKMCRKDHSAIVPIEGYEKWQAGTLIQDAMPDVSREDRELLISCTCPGCFETLCGELQ